MWSELLLQKLTYSDQNPELITGAHYIQDESIKTDKEL